MRSGFVMAALLASAGMAIPATAQDVRNLDQEQSDARVFSGAFDGKPVLFEVSLAAGEAMRVDVIATSEMDPVLRIYNAATGDLIVENDDGGDSLNSRAVVTATEDMDLRIEVSAFSAEAAAEEVAEAAMGDEVVEAGDGGFVAPQTFDLKLTALDYDAQGVRAVSWNAEEKGQIFGGEEHLFTFAGEEGLLLEVAMVADTDIGNELDPYLALRDASGQTVAENDDGGSDLNALLRYVMMSDEAYTIVASGLGDSVGGYTLRVGPRREPVVQAPLQVLSIDDTATGRVGAGYENGDLDPASIMYQLSDSALAAIRNGGSGEITVRMTKAVSDDPDFANGLDPYLELGFDTPLGFAVVQTDDDGAGDLNAMIPVDLSTLAENTELLDVLRIRVSGFGESSGDYVLTVTEGLDPIDAEYEDYLESSRAPASAPSLALSVDK
ncbi:hypothetical protein [Aurantiacibacter suaedae]|uniref:hypothetical protein n=1 Tax=Aurantiacibacter suaedae TaxID=2545755 RepID=UPI0010F464E1|nr:hypothetical protein [Aurantiacibacter suaedae]